MKKKTLLVTASVAVIALAIGTAAILNNRNKTVLEVDGVRLSADGYYDLLVDYHGDAYIYHVFENKLLLQVETSEEIATYGQTQEDNVLTTYADDSATLEYLDTTLKSVGFSGLDDLNLYYENTEKYYEVLYNYTVANIDTLYDDYAATYQPRLVSHILVSMADPANPTAEELAKIDTINQALASGMSFTEAATTYSDDTSTTEGSLGFVDSSSSLVTQFLDVALTLNAGETSGWTLTDDYGYHLIKVDSTSKEALLAYTGLYEAILNTNTAVATQAMIQLIEQMEVQFDDEATRQIIMGYLGN